MYFAKLGSIPIQLVPDRNRSRSPGGELINLLKKFVGSVSWGLVLIYFVIIMAWAYFVQHHGLPWIDGIVSTAIFAIVLAFIELAERRWKAWRNKG